MSKLQFLGINSASADSTVINVSSKNMWVIWQAWGCAGVVVSYDYSYFGEVDRVCNAKKIRPNHTLTYHFKWGTTGDKLYVYGSEDGTKSGIAYRIKYDNAANLVVLFGGRAS